VCRRSTQLREPITVTRSSVLLGQLGGKNSVRPGMNQTKVRFRRMQISGQLDSGAFWREAPDILINESKRVVILVEDDLSVLRALRRLIASAGFAVLAFAEPRALLESNIPKTDVCLVVDVHLPEMTGVELCEALVASGRRLPAIMITGQVDEATRELARRADPVAILFKPFSRESLLAALSDAFGAGRLT
jgi:CheY-like chemotaxis protein